MRLVFIAIGLILINISTVAGQIMYTGGMNYSQDFDSLASTGTANPWTNNSTLGGWFLYHQDAAGAIAIAMYEAGAGTNNQGGVYSFGSDLSQERALGSIGSGGAYWGSPGSNSVAGWIAVAFTNSQAQALKEFTITYDGEQWRDANNSAQTMEMEYGFGATFDGVATWYKPGGSFDFVSPVATNANQQVNGNIEGKVAGLGGTISGLSWMPGETLWIRFIEFNNAGTDHGLSVDNFQFLAVPEPGTGGMLAGLLAALAFVRRRRGGAKSA